MFDRALQLVLLKQMRDKYPNAMLLRVEHLGYTTHISTLQANIAYLEEHGLIRDASVGHTIVEMSDSGSCSNSGPRIKGTITAAGIDFLEDDGGLSAILGTVTVRLHADTIRDLVEAKINSSNEIPSDQKSGMIRALHRLPEDGLRTLTQELVKAGLKQGPEMWSNIARLLGLTG